MRRSIICCLLIASLIFCSTNFCFANPLDPWSDVETQIVTSGVQDIVSDVDTIRVALSTLYSYLTNNGDGVIEGLLVLANRVSNIINTLDYYLPLQNSVLQNLYSFFVPPTGDTRDIWDLLSQISANTTATSTALNTTNSELLTIDSHIDGVESSLNSIGSRLDTVNVNIQSLENINWNNTYAYIQFSIDNINYYDNISDLGSDSSYNIYVKLRFDGNLFNSLFYLNFHPDLNTSQMFNTNLNFEFYLYANGYIYPQDIDYYYDYYSKNLNLFIYPFRAYTWNDSNSVIIKISSDYPFTPSSGNNSKFLYYLTNNSVDFYIVDNFIQSHKRLSDTTLQDIKNILIDIDNNSDFIQNNNDLEINVDIDAADGQGITVIISKLQDLFDFGVGLQEFLVSLNEFDNLLWFTSLETYQQVNYNPNISDSGYQDLYD